MVLKDKLSKQNECDYMLPLCFIINLVTMGGVKVVEDPVASVQNKMARTWNQLPPTKTNQQTTQYRVKLLIVSRHPKNTPPPPTVSVGPKEERIHHDEQKV